MMGAQGKIPWHWMLDAAFSAPSPGKTEKGSDHFMFKIAVAQFQHESNTFAKYTTKLNRFRQTNLMEGQAILDFAHSGVLDYMSGVILEAEKFGDVEMVPLFSAYSMPSGTIDAEAYNYISGEILARLKAHAGEVDGLCFVLHGAGASECTLDVEGTMLKACREILGPNKPIIATLDLHANISAEMMDYADALVSCKLYPHSDTYETGCKAMDLMHGILADGRKPHMYVKKLPMMVQMSQGSTMTEPMKSVNALCDEVEHREGIFDCTFTHGFICADNAFSGACVIVIAETEEAARTAAEETGEKIFARRRDFYKPTLSPAEGVEKAKSLPKPVVLNEGSDNPGGGSPGDSTHLLRAMIDGGLRNCCYASIIDPETVAKAVAAGVGNTIDCTIGGKIDGLHGEPIAVKGAYVRSISDGKIFLRSRMMHGYPTFFGTTVRLVIDGRIDVIVCEVPNQIMDDAIFELMGIDVRKFDYIGLKSVVHFRDYFACITDIAKSIVSVDAPGICTNNLYAYDYKRIPHPIFPFELQD